MKTVTKQKILLITPSWPPAFCGVADFSEKLYKNLKTKYSCDYIVCGEKHCHKSNNPHKINIPALAAKKYAILHIIFHDQHQKKNSVFYDIPAEFKQASPDTKIVISAIKIDTLISKKLKKILKNTDGIIAYDHGTCNVLKKFNKPIIEMPCGHTINPSKNYIHNISHQNSPKLNILFFGFLNRGKGIETSLKAMDYIPKHLPINLLIKGALHETSNRKKHPDAAYRKNLAKKIHGLKDQRIKMECKFYKIKSLEKIFMSTDCCVMPFNDGVSNKRSSFFNALAYGLPVITTKSEITPIDFAKIPNIKLLNAMDFKQLADVIIHAYKQKIKNAPKDKKEAIEYFQKNYCWNKLLDRIVCFYEKISPLTNIG